MGHERPVGMIYLQGEGKESFLSMLSEGGISLLPPSLLLWGLKATPTGQINLFKEFSEAASFITLTMTRKWGTQPSPNFASSQILHSTQSPSLLPGQEDLDWIKIFPSGGFEALANIMSPTALFKNRT